ncbi:hypothetical protein GCM10027180_03840 [Microbulbifer echini]
MIRDVGWFRVIEKNWLFTVSITDWEEVERIAKKAQLASQFNRPMTRRSIEALCRDPSRTSSRARCIAQA